jgi:hypothetical protein
MAGQSCCFSPSHTVIGVFTVDSNGSLGGRLRKQLRLFCCMRFRFEKATQTDFNFDRTEFQTVLKAAELEFTAKFGNWQCYMPARQTTANLSSSHMYWLSFGIFKIH